MPVCAMEAVTWSEVQYKQVPVPELRITETRRRDSFASSRTADSGYNSDPDVALSPLDLLHPDDCEGLDCYGQECSR
jgi:hypothetical protein